MAELGIFRGLTKVRLHDGINARSYTVSVDDVVPDTASGDQTTWEDAAGAALTLRLEWDTLLAPVFLEADTAVIRVRLFGSNTDIGATWTPTISGASGAVTTTFHFDTNPLNGVSDATAFAGMVELFLTVQRVGVSPWGPVDSRGAGTPPSGITHDWAKGKFRGNIKLSSESLSNVSLAGAEPASFAFPDGMYTRLSFSAGTWFRSTSTSYTLRHLQSSTLRRTQANTAAGGNRDYSWTSIANGTTSNGRLNGDYTNANVDVEIQLPELLVAGDNEFAWHSSGQFGGYTKTNDRTLTDAARFAANPTITMTDLTFTDQVFAPEEITSISFKLTNARNELIPSTTGAQIQIRSSDNTAHENYLLAHNGTLFQIVSYLVNPNGKAPWDLVGERWNIHTNYADMDSPNNYNLTSDIFKVARKLQVSTSNSIIDGSIFTGRNPNPTSDDSTQLTRCDKLYCKGYLYTPRGTLWSGSKRFFLGIRSAADEAFNSNPYGITITDGEISGADAYVYAQAGEPTGSKTVVIATQPTITGNQPRTGNGGKGGFAETVTTEISVVQSVERGGLIYESACMPCCGCDCVSDGGWYLLPNRFLLIVTGVVNGTCSACNALNGEFVLQHQTLSGFTPSLRWYSPAIVDPCNPAREVRWGMHWDTVSKNAWYLKAEVRHVGTDYFFTPNSSRFLYRGVNDVGTGFPGEDPNATFNGDCADTDWSYDVNSSCNFNNASVIMRAPFRCYRPAPGLPFTSKCPNVAPGKLKLNYSGVESVLTGYHTGIINPPGVYEQTSGQTYPYLWKLRVPNAAIDTGWFPGQTSDPNAFILHYTNGFDTFPTVVRRFYKCHKDAYSCFGPSLFYNTLEDGGPATLLVEAADCSPNV